MIVDQNGIVCGTVGGGEIENRTIQEAIKCLMDGKSKRLTYSLIDPEKGDVGICGGTVELYVEPILPQPKMLVIGGGHVGKAVAHLAHWLGYRVIVSDDRPEFCTKENNPDADEFCITPMEEIPGHIKINPQTYIVLTTRGMDVDVVGLPALLETNARYIGIIGSKRRWLSTRKELADQGIPEEKLNRVYSPIGLELKAETPEENCNQYHGRNHHDTEWRHRANHEIITEDVMWQEYFNAADIEEVLNVLDAKQEHARVVAGATDLILEMETRNPKGH